jgi:hypothetical protein
MSNSTVARTVATAPVVRAAFKQGLFKAPEGISLASLVGADGTGEKVRGRIHPAFAEALVKAQPRKFSLPEAGEKATPAVKTVEVPRWSQKTGRPVKAVSLPIAEVRTLAGKPGSKGRLSKADLTAAAKAQGFGPREVEVTEGE